MLVRKALRYHRFSDKDQSNGSIERQEIITDYWSRQNNIYLVDTFVDDGYSAKTFDRPDIKKLFQFLKDQREKIDYLIVAELTRFSRDSGEAVTLVKRIQREYGIKIVSAGRNMIYDCTDHTSYLMMNLEFAMGNSENIKRENDINGGIYAAKTKEQRFIGSRAPFGYRKEGDRKKYLVIYEPEAAIVRFIYQSYLGNMPLIQIHQEARKLGYKSKGRSVIKNLLTNPIYSGRQLVKPWKDLPGGLFPAIHEPIIDLITWEQVQHKLRRPVRPGISVSEAFPLRNVLHCHCGRMLTGAPSRGKLGRYYNYYKGNCRCKTNINADKLHQQLDEVLYYLSLPEYLVDAIRDESTRQMDEQLEENKMILRDHLRRQQENEADIRSLEEKFIRQQVSFETYNRWHSDLINQRIYLKAKIDELATGENEIRFLLEKNLAQLQNMQELYHEASTIQKQNLLNLVFDNRLYYRNNTYRTPYIMPVFKHNLFTLNQKKLLVLDEKKDFRVEVPLGGAAGNIIEPSDQQPFIRLLHLIESIRVA